MADFRFIRVNPLPTCYDVVYRSTPHSPETVCSLLMALRDDLLASGKAFSIPLESWLWRRLLSITPLTSSSGHTHDR